MCGRFVITSPPAALRQIFGYIEQPNFPPRHNIAPTQPIPVVMLENGGRHFRLMRWGLVPAWVKDPRKFTLLINARSETVREKPAFKNAMKRRRVPGSGRRLLRMAGQRTAASGRFSSTAATASRSALQRWRKPGWARTARSSTASRSSPRRPAADLAALHHRVPVTIAPDDFERWLDGRGERRRRRHDAVDGALAKASSPGTRFRPGSIASPMTTRNWCCRSPTKSGRPKNRSRRRRPRRARRRRSRKTKGRGRYFEE